MEQMECEEPEVRPWSRSRSLPQFLAALSATLTSFCSGSSRVWLSLATGMLEESAAPTFGQQKSAYRLQLLGAMLGALVAGRLLQWRGPRGMLLLLVVPFALGHAVVLALHTHRAWLFLARFLFGVASGAMHVAAPVYLVEILEDSHRGKLGCFMCLMLKSGHLFVHLLNLAGSYVLLAACCFVVPLASTAVLFWMPESPLHLLARNRRQEATESLRWLRGGHRDVAGELQCLQASVDEVARPVGTWRDLACSPVAAKALGISMALVAFQELSGHDLVGSLSMMYLVLAGSSWSKETTLVVVAVPVAGSCLGLLLADRLGRRVLLLTTGLAVTVSLLVLGVYFRPDEPAHTWVPFLCALVFSLAFNVGLGPLLWTLMAELMPPNVRGLGAALVGMYFWLLKLIMSWPFYSLARDAHRYVYWCFFPCCILAIVVVYFIVPETNGKSVRQVQEEMKQCMWSLRQCTLRTPGSYTSRN
ncbi:facilitated trehalose transporter Tret1-2 homolog [Bacillus rossius redtenbacheri]|uniref:facilitated trehalose transporter Tret1-2 homolog n=1 Tax=Bacillus rossius redtenbacheri TaxID=93214 RepID=UPI002FDD7E79